MRVVLAALPLFAAMASPVSVVSSFPAPDGDISGLAWMNDTLFAVDALSGIVYAIDPDDGSVSDSWETAYNVSATSLGAGSDTLYAGFANGWVRGYSPEGLAVTQVSLVC